MSVAINLKTGPFSQIGLEIASLTTAYQLATGVYGWFKGYERSKSLTEMISVSGGELVSTSSFNFNLYRRIREDHSNVQGVVVQGGRMQRTRLPKASTAVPDHPGVACIRALTAGLLCMFSTDATVEVLQDLIPATLIQLDQEDTKFEIEGAVLTSLRHWVSAIATEEDSDLFRDHMLKEVRSQESKLTGMAYDEIMEIEYDTNNEIPFVIGVLRWVLTPLHKRDIKQYPTRSLKAWAMALIMQNLGFVVQADPTLARVVDDWEGNGVSGQYGGVSYVRLVPVNYDGEADPMPIMHVARTSDAPRPQITMVRGIPWIAFRHLQRASEIKTDYLADIWKFSFRSAKAAFRGISMWNQNIHVEAVESELNGVSDHHKTLISVFSPQIERICGPALRQFVPILPDSPGWSLTELQEQMRTLKTQEELYNPQTPCRRNCYVLYAIVCGSLYGLCSNACYSDGVLLTEDSEIAFMPDVLYERSGAKIKEWATTVGHALQGHQCALIQWSDLLFEMFLGKETQSGSLATMKSSSRNSYMNQQNPYQDRLRLGAQANGLAAVVDMLVNTTIRGESFCYMHIQRGQIISFPLTEDKYIQASSYIEPAFGLELDPEPQNSTLRQFDLGDPATTMRVDVEPCWDDDPRTVSFVVRLSGVPIASLNISAFLDRISYGHVDCKCPRPSWEVAVPFAERWQLLHMYQIQRRRIKVMSFRRVDVDFPGNRILVDASRSVAATVYAVCILHVRHMFVAQQCLKCSYDMALRNSQYNGVAIILPYRADSS